MDRYGRDNRHRGWLEKAEDTVGGWFSGGHHRDYDRDYGRDYGHTRGYTGGRVVERISPGYDRDRVRFVNRGYDRGYASQGPVRGYDNRDFGGRGTTPSGYVSGRGSMGYGADYDRGYGAYDYNRGGQYGAGGGTDLTNYGLGDRFGAYNNNRFRSSGGAWRSGGYYTGYGVGSPHGYMP